MTRTRTERYAPLLLATALAALAPLAAVASLQVPSYAAPQFAAPVPNAYAWVSALDVDFSTGAGHVTVWVHPDAASANAGKPPLDTFRVALGDQLAPGVTFPTLGQLELNAATLQARDPTLTPFASLRAAIYQALVNHPKLAGATQVP